VGNSPPPLDFSYLKLHKLFYLHQELIAALVHYFNTEADFKKASQSEPCFGLVLSCLDSNKNTIWQAFKNSNIKSKQTTIELAVLSAGNKARLLLSLGQPLAQGALAVIADTQKVKTFFYFQL
jgi:hypothetical protein